ncbi:MAG: HPr family phosphocarrier protein [Clostridiales Family XIII bacterium]|jgi:phosphocarrier protein|nr:HPr family phosphocarrier protein [Clostridiales Family XIII bacterium]
MRKQSITINNKTGLHARPASDFVKLANQFSSDIQVTKEGTSESANAKSIIYLLSLGLNKGTTIEITAEGDDEDAAVDALIALVDSGLGE